MAAPMLIVGTLVGIAVALVQALTSIQESTLTFVPKIVAMMLTMILFLPFMTTSLIEFTQRLFDRIVAGRSAHVVPAGRGGEVFGVSAGLYPDRHEDAFLPGFSAAWVPVRLRPLALLLSLLHTAGAGKALPPMLPSPAALALLLAGEATVGLFLGLGKRIAFAALQIAGTTAALLSSFANALVQDPVVDQQSSAARRLLHHARRRHRSRRRPASRRGGAGRQLCAFLPQAGPSLGDLAAAITRAVADSFALGVQLAAPFIIVNLVYNVGMALLGRLVPQSGFRLAYPAGLADLGDDAGLQA
ncbi:MAG: flagellar biosynthetic protein FliR [Rhodospirillales bacterium]